MFLADAVKHERCAVAVIAHSESRTVVEGGDRERGEIEYISAVAG